jgi:hypothetical protein
MFALHLLVTCFHGLVIVSARQCCLRTDGQRSAVSGQFAAILRRSFEN